MSTEVVVALIATIGVIAAGLPATLIERARRENADDHAVVRARLRKIGERLDGIQDSIDDVAEVVGNHIGDPDAHRDRSS